MGWLLIVGWIEEVEVGGVPVASCFLLRPEAFTIFGLVCAGLLHGFVGADDVDVLVRCCLSRACVSGVVYVLAIIRLVVVIIFLVGVLWGDSWVPLFLGRSVSQWGLVCLLYRCWRCWCLIRLTFDRFDLMCLSAFVAWASLFLMFLCPASFAFVLLRVFPCFEWISCGSCRQSYVRWN